MTLYDVMLFQAIPPPELLSLNWTKGKGPNVNKLIEHFSAITDWVRSEVISDEQVKVRVIKLSKSIVLAEHLLEMQNFNSALAIYIGLELLRNLEAEWKKLTQKVKSKWKLLDLTLTMQRDFLNLRKRFYQAEGPIIVPLNILLHDLAVINEQPKLYHETSLFNFTKLRHIYGVFRLIEITRNSSYGFEPVPIIQDFIKNFMKNHTTPK